MKKNEFYNISNYEELKDVPYDSFVNIDGRLEIKISLRDAFNLFPCVNFNSTIKDRVQTLHQNQDKIEVKQYDIPSFPIPCTTSSIAKHYHPNQLLEGKIMEIYNR